MSIKYVVTVSLSAFAIVWIWLLYSVFFSSGRTEQKVVTPTIQMELSQIKNNIKIPLNPNSIKQNIISPKRYKDDISTLAPPSVEEIKKNMTLYLQTLHGRIRDIAGPTVTGQKIWDTFLEVTSNMPMKWDDMNKDRYHKPRKDKSIFVGLVTYRDPFCPMTIKSLFSQARRPDKLSVVLFQQNCFEKVCRTGVLKGGIIENAETDINCYTDFCNSNEGIRSNACNTGQIKLFNVNESESLGPYMARYLAVKFYQGEQYYLQIDSHSEFVSNWDDKLIKMVDDAPAEKPIISCYPPGQSDSWQDSIGYRICDSEFAASQIEWQIIRLGSGLAFDHQKRSVPAYAPFVAAGFFFGYADLLHEVSSILLVVLLLLILLLRCLIIIVIINFHHY